MEYKNGYIFLEQSEIDFLSIMLMKDDIDSRYDANELLGALKAIQTSLIQEKQRYLSLSDRGAKEDAAVSFIEVTHVSCGQFIELAHKAAQKAGKKIEYH